MHRKMNTYLKIFGCTAALMLMGCLCSCGSANQSEEESRVSTQDEVSAETEGKTDQSQATGEESPGATPDEASAETNQKTGKDSSDFDEEDGMTYEEEDGVIDVYLNTDDEQMSQEESQKLVYDLYDDYCEQEWQDPERLQETTYEDYNTQYEGVGDRFSCGTIQYDGYEMKYGVQTFGEVDENGKYPLYIVLHGGGSSEPSENDQQWEAMFYYYANSVMDGVYVNVRGITDTWNLHFLDQSYYMYDRLIEDMILNEQVDPNRIYLLGFSAGGDGVYQIAAHMADRFAAVNMSSGHPNDVSLINLANLPILLQAGIRDNYYDRNTVTVESGEKLDQLALQYGFGYENELYIHVPEGHNYADNDPDVDSQQQVLADPLGFPDSLEENDELNLALEDPDYAYEDSDDVNELAQQAVDDAGLETEWVDSNAVRWVSQYSRDPYPENLVWDLDTRAGMRTVDSFYYLKAPADTTGVLTASYDKENNEIRVDTGQVDGDFSILLNPLMLDLSQPVKITVDDQTFLVHANPSKDCISASLQETSDLYRAYAAEVSYQDLLSHAEQETDA